MKLHCYPGNPRTAKVLIAANYLNIPLTVRYITTHNLREKEIKALSPFGKVPILETQNGGLSDSNSILKYMASLSKDTNIAGQNSWEECQVLSLLDFISSEIEPAIATVLYPYLGLLPYSKSREHQASTDLTNALRLIDSKIKTSGGYLCQSGLTIADISLASELALLYKYTYTKNMRDHHPNISAWYEKVSSLPAFVKVFGKYVLCNAPLEVPSCVEIEKSEPEKPAKKQAQNKEGATEQKKGNAAAQKKEAAPAQKKEEAAQKPKATEEKKQKKDGNPLDLLPPSKFVLNDFKFMFVNNKDKEDAMNKFWSMYDHEGWSLWKLHYEKYEGEGKVLFLTNNLSNGFLQRLDEFRKYAFGVHGVYGDEPELEIRGVWLWRGVDIAPNMKEHPTYQWVKITKLSHTNEEDKKLVHDYWTKMNEGDIVDGMKVNDVSYFKQYATNIF